MLCGGLWCYVMLCGVLSCSMMFCGVLWCYVVFCDVLWCSVVFCGAMWCSVMFYDVLWCSVMLCNVLWCSVMLCDVLWCSVMLCGVLWCCPCLTWRLMQCCRTEIATYTHLWWWQKCDRERGVRQDLCHKLWCSVTSCDVLWCYVVRVGQSRIYTPYITVYTVISLPKIPYIHRMYMVLANPICGVMWCSVMFCNVVWWYVVLCGVPWCSAMSWVGQNHTYTVCIRYFWQGDHQIYGHLRCIYTVWANPSNVM
jgi:hypothetical protein